MNADIHLEHRAGSRQGKHDGEPSLGLCDRLNRTRDNSQRQLPTDHDYAVSTREYQTDQSSLKTAPAAARSVFGKGKQPQRQKQTHGCAELTRSLHIRPIEYSGPVVKTMTVEGSKARLYFAHAGSGLSAKGGKLVGFEIAGKDHKFVPADAVIDGQSVVVSADEVAEPVSVRYAWQGFTSANLYNSAGLPASTFTTEPSY
jgi:sialate O-acetylesterase